MVEAVAEVTVPHEGEEILVLELDSEGDLVRVTVAAPGPLGTADRGPSVDESADRSPFDPGDRAREDDLSPEFLCDPPPA